MLEPPTLGHPRASSLSGDKQRRSSFVIRPSPFVSFVLFVLLVIELASNCQLARYSSRATLQTGDRLRQGSFRHQRAHFAPVFGRAAEILLRFAVIDGPVHGRFRRLYPAARSQCRGL